MSSPKASWKWGAFAFYFVGRQIEIAAVHNTADFIYASGVKSNLIFGSGAKPSDSMTWAFLGALAALA